MAKKKDTTNLMESLLLCMGESDPVLSILQLRILAIHLPIDTIRSKGRDMINSLLGFDP